MISTIYAYCCRFRQFVCIQSPLLRIPPRVLHFSAIHWRAGASQPNRAAGTIFLYTSTYIPITYLPHPSFNITCIYILNQLGHSRSPKMLCIMLVITWLFSFTSDTAKPNTAPCCIELLDPAPPRAVLMKALKCKTLGGIHMQSTAATELCTYNSVVYILRMRVRVPRCLCLYLACFTPVAPVASL